MQKRMLGNSKLEVSAIGIGYMSMTSGSSRSGDRLEMITLIRATVELTAVDLGDIESNAAPIAVQGAPYPENLERQTNR